MPSHLLSPAADETLSDFLRRAMRERGLSVPALVDRIVALDPGADADTVERRVKRQRSGRTRSLQKDKADVLGAALVADFSPFVLDYTNGNGPRVTLAQLHLAVEEVGVSVADLRARLHELQERLEELERGQGRRE